MQKFDDDFPSEKKILPLLEFIYETTGSWTQSLEKYRDFNDEENRSALILYESIYFFMYLIRRISYNKLPKEKAEKLNILVKSLVIIGIVDLVMIDEPQTEKDKIKLDFLSKIELAELDYMKGTRKVDSLEEGTPIITKFRRRIALAANHEDDEITPRIGMLTESIYNDFLLEKLEVLEKMLMEASEAV